MVYCVWHIVEHFSICKSLSLYPRYTSAIGHDDDDDDSDN